MNVSEESIRLRVSNKKAYVWDVDDIAKLRARHRICGMLTGTLPHLSQQNVFLGVPLLLMPEEVVLLVEKGFACLVDDQSAHDDPSPALLDKWNDARLGAVRHQLVAAEEEQGTRTRHTSPAMSEEALRKRREREQKRAGVLAGSAELPLAPPEGRASAKVDRGTDPDTNHEQRPPSNAAKADAAGATYTVHVTASSTHLDWYKGSTHLFTTLASAREAGLWDYPTTTDERARCAVFRDLWEKGYFMGGGIKFGGEYLVYPGDPLRYHSHFVASVISSPRAPLRAMEIVAHGRLGTGTKKSHLLCEWDEARNTVTYYSIEWAGFG